MMPKKISTQHVDRYLDPKKPKPEISRMLIRLPAELKQELDQAARDLDRSLNDLAISAFRRFLERHRAAKEKK